MSTCQNIPPNKNAAVRRRLNKQSKDKSTEKNINKHNFNSGTIHNIKIFAYEEDPDSFVLSVDTIVDRFREGVIVIDFGQISVYLNLCFDFLNDIENMAIDEQKEFSSLLEVYTYYKTFLLYRNKKGNTKILPKNQHFYTAFETLKKEIDKNANFESNVSVMLKDVYKTKQQQKEDMHLEMKNWESKSNAKKSDTKGREFSLTASKTKTILSRRKLLITEHSSAKFPQLPSPIPLKRIFIANPLQKEQFQFPVQVSEEQRDDEQTHSEQAVPFDNTDISRDNITYGFSSHSGVNRRMYSSATSHAPILPESDQRAHGRLRTPPRYPDYCDYADRLISFSRWQLRNPDPPRLSQAGFFFTNNGDLVRCFQCGIGLKDFSSEDDPLLEHVRHSGQCQFLPELLGEQGLSLYKRHLQDTDPEYSRQHQWHEQQTGSASRSNFRHPEYQTLQSRISTFANWPSDLMQTPEQLAAAGLYYTGFEDHVRCFACDGGLRRWDPEDDPWTEHCRWFPACPYAIEQKGEQFIALVQASVENEGYEAIGGIQDLTGELEHLQLRDTEIEHITAQHREVCLEMGYKEEDVKEAVKEFIERGNKDPNLEDIIELIDVIRERNQSNFDSSKHNESPMEVNQRLKSFVFCMSCGKNNVNALFLPCTHHKLCMPCAESTDDCPVCHRHIREKIRTYMA